MKAITEMTDGQKKQYLRVVEDAAERALKDALIDKDGIQKLIENGDEFQARILSAIQELSISNQFADEETDSSYEYSKEFKGLGTAEDEILACAKIFDLDPTQALEFCKNIPQHSDVSGLAEGYVAIPKISALAKKHFSEITDPAQQYCEAVKLVHKKLAESRSFYNYREGEIIPSKLRQRARTIKFLEQLETEQPGDILVIAVQCGLKHRGQSPRRAIETFISNEFGFGAFAVGCIALIHPELYMRYDELDTDCPGDEFSPGGDAWSMVPYFSFNDDMLKFGTRWDDDVREGCGSVSGFVSQ